MDNLINIFIYMEYIINNDKLSKLIYRYIESAAGDKLYPVFVKPSVKVWTNDKGQSVVITYENIKKMLISRKMYKEVKEMFHMKDLEDMKIIFNTFNVWFNNSQDALFMDPKKTYKSFVDFPL